MPRANRYRASTAAAVIVAALNASLTNAQPRPAPAPFTATLSNNTPLAFGMNALDAARALGEPLIYVSGPSGAEIFLAIRHAGGSGFFPRNDRLYLQFRGGRLTAWKGDWGSRWLW
jgi:hypothetical protein